MTCFCYIAPGNMCVCGCFQFGFYNHLCHNLLQEARCLQVSNSYHKVTWKITHLVLSGVFTAVCIAIIFQSSQNSQFHDAPATKFTGTGTKFRLIYYKTANSCLASAISLEIDPTMFSTRRVYLVTRFDCIACESSALLLVFFPGPWKLPWISLSIKCLQLKKKKKKSLYKKLERKHVSPQFSKTVLLWKK